MVWMISPRRSFIRSEMTVQQIKQYSYAIWEHSVFQEALEPSIF